MSSSAAQADHTAAVQSAGDDDTGSIAIIAMTGRFAGADNIDEYWSMLLDGRSGSRQLDGTATAPGLVPMEAAIKGVDMFDADLFGLRPSEAELIDPQHRLFLECVHEAFEQAGFDPTRTEDLVGVYAGCGQQQYYIRNVLPHLVEDHSWIDSAPGAFANSLASLPTRVSYQFNLTGPSVAVQTACSTSLSAVHLACQELLDFRCDIAVAGGVTINPAPGLGYPYSPGGPLAPDGYCRAFDAKAAGMFPGDGVGVVILKRLDEALANGDRIRAVIKGSAQNNDGRRKAGFTAPSVEGQTEAILAAHAIAGVSADSIGMVEAHGTATPVGDPIEVAALTRAFRVSTDQSGYCLLGSAKTNIGHTDTAAGVAGLIKAALAVEAGVVPKSLHFDTPNPLIDFENSPFVVATETTPWPISTGPRRAGISAFGIGGTNVHVVIEQAPAAARRSVPVTATHRPQLIVLSAATPEALDQQVLRLTECFRVESSAALDSIARTLAVGRRQLPYRLAVAAQSHEHAQERLRTHLTAIDSRQGIAEPVFMFSGGGTQYPHMGAGLYRSESVFRSSIDLCHEVLAADRGLDLRATLFDPSGMDERNLDVVLPALFATEYALAQQLISWGIHPSALIGQSLGEYVAATVAGVFDIEQVVPLVSERGRLLSLVDGGGIVSVLLDPSELAPYLHGDLVISGVNARTVCTVSGPSEQILELVSRLDEFDVQHQRVRLPSPMHSPQLDPILDRMRQAFHGITLRPPKIPYLSNVTGTWIRADDAIDPAYWVRHSREPVQLAASFDELIRNETTVVIEAGPGRSLSRLAEMHSKNSFTTIATMRHRDDVRDDLECLLDAVGTAWSHGVSVDWNALTPDNKECVALPAYPFDRKRHWIDAAPYRNDMSARTADRRRTPGAPPQFADKSNSGTIRMSVPSWRTSPPLAPNNAPNRVVVAADLDAQAQSIARPLSEAFGLHVQVHGPTASESDIAEYEHIVFLAGSELNQSERQRHHNLARLVSTASVRTVYIRTREAFDVIGTEQVDPDQSAAAAAADWLRDTSPNVNVIVIDTDNDGAEDIAHELLTGSEDQLVAYRSGRRWLGSLVAQDYPVDTSNKVELRPVSGDFCDGLAAARQITDHCPEAAKIALAMPGSGTLDAALVSGYISGAVTSRHRAGIRDLVALSARGGADATSGTLANSTVAAAFWPETPILVIDNAEFTPAQPPQEHSQATTDPTVINQRPALSTKYVAPRTALEESIAQIWRRHFGYDRIGVYDQFLELGGESLLAMQIVASQSSALGIKISMRQLLDAGSIAAIAASASESPTAVARKQPETTPPARRGRPALRTASGLVVEQPVDHQ